MYTDEPALANLDDLDETLSELLALGLIQQWPSRETRFRAVADQRDN